jgi:hypothetical protein
MIDEPMPMRETSAVHQSQISNRITRTLLTMRFDTHPGNTPLPVAKHSLSNCACGHSDESHEAVDATVGEERKELVICLECDADD